MTIQELIQAEDFDRIAVYYRQDAAGSHPPVPDIFYSHGGILYREGGSPSSMDGVVRDTMRWSSPESRNSIAVVL